MKKLLETYSLAIALILLIVFACLSCSNHITFTCREQLTEDYIYVKQQRLNTALRIADDYRDAGVRAITGIDENNRLYIEIPCNGINAEKTKWLIFKDEVLPDRFYDGMTRNVKIKSYIQ
jgi:hypothetical protein